ncbi:MAG: phosphotransferase, partial [Alphaproteobacteria bacterium]
AGARVGGRGVLLRVPRLSQWGAAPADHLAYQAAGFARAAASRHAPLLFAMLAVSPELPMGALVVEEIAGRKPRLPGDMGALAQCLAAFHMLKLPPMRARPPLRVHRDPAAATLAVIEEQAAYLDGAGLTPAARALIDAELAWAREYCDQADSLHHKPSRHPRQPITLVATDSHPGNFLIERGGGGAGHGGAGRAVFVDLEKVLYGSPAIDLAHASLYTSTRWDPDCAATLTAAETAGFYRAYLGRVGPESAARLKPWLGPMRRLTYLRTFTWCARWQVLSRAEAPGAGPVSPWSASLLPPELAAHVTVTVADYFAIDTIEAIIGEWRRGDTLLEALERIA